MSDSELQFTYAHHFQYSCPELVEFLIFLLTDKMNANKLTFSQKSQGSRQLFPLFYSFFVS